MNTHVNLSKPLMIVALVTGIILLVPLIVMQYTTEVNWGVGDFIVMGILLFGTGAAFVILTAYSYNAIHKVAMVFAIGATFLMIWSNLAVGLIGGGANAGNLMYAAVLLVGLVGTYHSRFSSRGMERTMFAMALTFVLIAIIALVANMQDYPGSSVKEIIGVNALFTILYVIAGMLFRFVGTEEDKQLKKSNS
ncbi:hypothetical protein SanaruYs_03160 [Chryseotalea sanaruensis]|uniref:Uncharacterized protein n=1 Tax=Chryseotalea sanaruensis TaxID=2482724 RepID=A0A401U5B4_9BACT|nr:hypothetical protein [Chryseotalea sanaruensis]GCC50101.1 hypothetical protein SanaruYs_03160 [Chryseotalea sanaruensis]